MQLSSGRLQIEVIKLEQHEIELRKLEEVADRLESKHLSVPPPMFEIFVTIFSISVAILFFAYPSMLLADKTHYKNLISVMPQIYWAFSFFIACMFKSLGLFFEWQWSRLIGLVLSAVLYVAMAICYAMNFPSITSIVFAEMAIFSVFSMPLVKHSSLRLKEDTNG